MTTPAIQRSKKFELEQLINQAFDFEKALHSALEEVGEKFGLYDILAQDGPITAPCLATQAGIPLRTAQIWLSAQASGNYLKHYPTTGLYSLWSTWLGRTA